MDVNTIASLIGSFGFPVVACGCMGFFIKWLISENNKTISQLTKALNNNTNVMTEINTLLKFIFEREEKKDGESN